MKKYPALVLLLLSSLLIGLSGYGQDKAWKISSPDKSLQMILSLQSGKLTYRVEAGSQLLIQPSSLGLNCADESFSEGLSYVSQEGGMRNAEYSMKIGKRSMNRSSFQESKITFKHQGRGTLVVECRAYNDGIAFRYLVGSPGQHMTVTKELTGFSVPSGKCWAEGYGLPTSYSPAYENDYADGIPVGSSAPDAGGWAFPLLINSQGYWMLITETNLGPNYFGSHLEQHCENGLYRIAMPLEGEALGKGAVTASGPGPITTPWRVMMLGKTPGKLVESNLVYDLADPNAIGDAGWVSPGRSSWSWWSDHPSSRDFTKLKNYVDLAADMGWEYSLVDANWNIMGNGGNIEDLVHYAAEKKIGLSLWYNSGGAHNNVTEQPRNIMNDPVKRKEEFKKLNQWGVKAVKVDFFQSDKQDIIRLYLDILRDAAAQKIMVIFHGCTLPRGWSRTYPNLLSMEAVKGAEQYGWDSVFALHAPIHNTILAFTRNVVGPMDYTPVTFSSYPCCTHSTSNAHELALSVVFESGMLHFADNQRSYEELDPRIRKFLGMVPNTWDDTRYLSGEPGKDIILARRKGKDWYIAGINGENQDKTISIDLALLHAGAGHAVIFTDGDDQTKIRVGEKEVKANDRFQVNLLPRGGFVCHLSTGH